MAKKSKSIKINNIEIKDHRNVSFTVAFIFVLIAFTAGVLAYHYIFMIHPSKPGCVQISVKTGGGNPVENAKVEIFMAILVNQTGELVARGYTGPGGKIKFCEGFGPNIVYKVIVIDQYGDEIWAGYFETNERSTADFPVIVMEKNV